MYDSPNSYTATMWPLFLLAVLALAVSLVLFEPASYLRSQIQLLAVPLVAFLLLSSRILTIAIPRFVIIVGAAAASLALLASGMRVGTPYAQVTLSRLQGDSLEADTRVMRERINQALRRLTAQFGLERTLSVHGLRQEIGSVDHALREMGALPEGLMFVWGTSRWLQISFGKNTPFVSKDSVLDLWLDLHHLQMVRYVPIVGLSFNPAGDTAAFIAALYGALALAKHVASQKLPQEFEMLLRYAAGYEGLWSSAAHRALPYWILGNYHLTRALQSGYESGEIVCALEAYRQARGLLRAKDNHWLLSAILNNQALAMLVKKTFEGDKQLRMTARKNLKAAKRLGATLDHWKLSNQAAAIAGFNLKSLKQSGRAKGGWREVAGAKKPSPGKTPAKNSESRNRHAA